MTKDGQDGSVPKVGIFWGIGENIRSNSRFTLVTDVTDLANAEPYGQFLTHPRAHYDVWEFWRGLGPAGLAKRGLPAQIVWHEYEEFPRGRVVFDTEADTFIIYADRQLQDESYLEALRQAFGLKQVTTVVRSDMHYVTHPPWR